MFRNPPKPPIPPAILDRLVKEYGRGGTRGGKSRGGQSLKYRDPETGIEYSRRHVEQTTKLGGITYEEAAIRKRVTSIINHQTREPMAYDERFGQLAYRYGRKHRTTKRETLAEGSDFWRVIEDLTRSGVSAGTRKAQALVELGLRKPEWTFAVGESPQHGKSADPIPESIQLAIQEMYGLAPQPFGPGGYATAPMKRAKKKKGKAAKKKKGRAHPRRSR